MGCTSSAETKPAAAAAPVDVEEKATNTTTTTIISHEEAPVKKEMDGAKIAITDVKGLRAMEICVEPGFDWKEKVGKNMPGCPEWCQATHFGYLRQGEMTIRHQDGREDVTIKTGDTYHVAPGHIPIVNGPEAAVMVEFSQDPNQAKMVDSVVEK
jgi:hypothetical protein